MDSLPSEIRVHIFSFLPLNDRTTCRKVCCVFRDAVDVTFNNITHVRVCPEGMTNYNRWNYAYEKFLSGPFDQVYLKEFVDENGHPIVNPKFLDFLAKFCPNLQVLDAGHLSIAKNSLSALANHLRYFRCDQFFFSKNSIRRFEQLEGFRATKQEKTFGEVLFLMASNRIRQEKRIFELMYPYEDSIDLEDLKYIAKVGVDCLNVSGEPSEFYPISRELAESVVSLKISFIPTLEFCQGPFINLKYLHIVNTYFTMDDKPFSDLLFASSGLKSFHFDGPMDLKQLKDLFRHFPSLNDLKSVILSLDILSVDIEEQLILSLPPQVEYINLNMDTPFVLTDMSSSQLKYFEANQLLLLDFDFPNLRVLSLTVSEEAGASDLINLVAKCPQLEQLVILWRVDVQVEYFESFINVLASFNNLQKLSISSSRPLPEDDRSPLILDQRKLLSVKNCFFDLYACVAPVMSSSCLKHVTL